MAYSLRIDPQSQLLLHLLRCDLKGLALGGAPSPVHQGDRGADVSSAEQDADWSKEVVGGASNILQDHKVEEVFICREEDFTDDHACDVSDEKDNGKKHQAENIL